MTELENHLLNALRDLSAQFKAQHESSKSALNTLPARYERTLKENAILSRQVESLQNQTTELNRQVTQFVSLYNQNR
ncbi:MbeD/MobD family mobilization/exclusion protein, partial [Klebsiella pneumoniae]|uniref:MbeD/MobD family mobilization/exclusion protein n=1 Tax=Klebsiella pneumoniae TaxID=573 RepID=UPI003AF0C63E